jgi:Flp pilus assembly protein TadD
MPDAAPDYLPDLLRRLQILQGDGSAVMQSLEQAALEHPGDARVFLLLGAERMHGKDVDGAEAAYIAALQLAPTFHIARFQLGLLQLTSGRPAAALSTWTPLDQLDDKDPLRLFKTGLEFLAQDRFEEARRWLMQGIAQNQSNPPLNRDMQMVLDRVAHLGACAGPVEQGDGMPDPETTAPGSGDHFLVSAYRKVH